MLSFQDFARAASLVERHALSSSATLQLPPAYSFQDWRTQAHLTSADRLARRLQADDLDLAAVQAYMNGATPLLTEFPLWSRFLGRVLQRERSGRDVSGYSHPFSGFIDPFAQQALDDLSARLVPIPATRSALIFGLSARQGLGTRLFDLAARVLVAEMHQARGRGQLAGLTADARYAAFVEEVACEGMARILQGYPVLARLMATACNNWVDAAAEMMGRLQRDAQALGTWRGREIGVETLVDAMYGLGDPHRSGRTVWKLQFTDDVLIYKPRTLGVDSTFQQLLAWLNGLGLDPHFPLLSILDRETHGWTEFVEQAPCADEAEVVRYYRRLGGLICLAQVLDGTDFHSSNLVASGEFPLLIDLEGLFHPRRVEARSDSPAEAALDFLGQSPLRTGLLPAWQGEAGNRQGVETSGIGSAPDQLVRRQIWEAPFTDQMRLGHEMQPLGSCTSHVILAGERIAPENYEQALVAGYRSVWGLLADNIPALLQSHGPLQRFATCRTRFIFQNTLTYSIVQEASLHPDLLRDGVQRDAALDRLWLTASDDPRYDRLIAAACADLWSYDVPLFQVDIAGCKVHTARGATFDLLNRSSLSTVAERLRGMRPEHADSYIPLLRASLATLSTSDREHVRRQPLGTSVAPDWISIASRIGTSLSQSAIRAGSGATWLGVVFARGRWRLGPLPSALYDGLSGVAFFLAYLADQTGGTQFASLCDEVLAGLSLQLDEPRLAPTGIGAFTGWSSLLYLYTHLFAVRGDAASRAAMERPLAEIEKALDADQAFDWMDGAAGCAAVLLGAYEQTNDARMLALAAHCGEHLLSNASPVRNGIGWLRHRGSQAPLTGLAHGAAGIGLALRRLGRATGDLRFNEGAQAALCYERSLFNPNVGNWPDLRETDDQDKFMTAWCHGAPGIAMARLELAEDDAAYAQDVQAGLAAVRADGFGKSPCLCHGDLGNLDLLLQAGHTEEASSIGASIVALHNGFRQTGRHHFHESFPGLMLGWSGIGLEMLRIVAPRKVPSPLILATPKKRHLE